MAPKGDPFNFDEIYSSMGASGFVKKKMGDELKPKTPAGGSAVPPMGAAAAPMRGLSNSGSGAMPSAPMAAPMAAPAPVVPQPVAPSGLSDMDFDFLSGAAPAAPPTAQAYAQSSGAASADPFAAFDTVDGALPAVATPPASQNATPSSSSLNLMGMGGADSMPPPPQQLQHSTSQADNFPVTFDTTFNIPETMPAAPVSKPPPQQPQQQPRQQKPPQVQHAVPNAPHPIPSQAPHHDRFNHSESGGAQASGYSDASSTSGIPNSHMSATPISSPNTSSSSTTMAAGFTGMLAGFTKRAVKAAKQGLQQLEQALEKMDYPAPAAGGKLEGGQQDGGQQATRAGSRGGATLYAEDLDGKDPLAVALRVMELPPRMWEEALQTLPLPLRLQVADIVWGDNPSTVSLQAQPAGGESHSKSGTHVGHKACIPVSEPSYSVLPPSEKLVLPTPAPTQVPPSPPETDLLGGMHEMSYDPVPPSDATSHPGAQASATGATRTTATTTTPSDVGDFFGGGGATGAPEPAAVSSPDDMHDFFSGGQQQSQPQPQSSKPAASSRPAPTDSFLNFDDSMSASAAPSAAYQHLYADGDVEVDGEPEERKKLRAARIALRNAKMQEALNVKVQLEEEEARKKAEQVTLKDHYKASVLAWEKKHSGNIRGLIGSLETVLWPDSGWKPISMSDLLEPTQVKRAYMKANLLVHPDKVHQRNGSADQVALADMIFDVLKDAWKAFPG